MTVPQEGAVTKIYNNIILLFPISCHGLNGEHMLANIYGCQFLQQDVSDVVEIFTRIRSSFAVFSYCIGKLWILTVSVIVSLKILLLYTDKNGSLAMNFHMSIIFLHDHLNAKTWTQGICRLHTYVSMNSHWVPCSKLFKCEICQETSFKFVVQLKNLQPIFGLHKICHVKPLTFSLQ